MEGCVFCACTDDEKILANEFVFARFDLNPVTSGHCLVITNRHVESYFDAKYEEKEAIWQMIDDVHRYLAASYSPEGFNVGINVGDVAGQTEPHLHIHIIPRYRGDTSRPRGGVRGVIPEKQSY